MPKVKYSGFKIHKNSAGHAVDILIRDPVQRKRNRHEVHQVYILQIFFNNCPFLDERELGTIMKLTSLTETQVRVWFNNTRARSKRRDADSDPMSS